MNIVNGERNRIMGLIKDKIIEEAESNSANWRTWKCKHCKENYKVNIKTRTNVNEEGFCPDCRNKIMGAA
jgi:predicted SprT family Zn-dependent metalloprotease